MKRIIFILFCIILSSIISAQGKWQGFFKPVPNDLLKVTVDTERAKSGLFLFRPTVSLSAMRFTYVHREGMPFEVTAFNQVGGGMSYQHFISTTDGAVYNDYGFSLLALFATNESTPNLSIAGTVQALQYINVGAGYDFSQKKLFFLTGITYSFN